MAAPPHLSCPPRRRRRRQHLLVSSVVASAASAAAILVALAGLPPPANADSTTIYTRPGVGGAPPTCALPSVKRAAGVASTCPGDRSTASGSPFLVPPAAAAAAAALGYEHEELYTPGGLPPVHVGDTLGDGNYTVVAKLGYGSFSTVWAADHVATGRRVAIKLWRSTGWTTDMADEEHGYLKELAAVDPTAAFPVMRLLDSFVHPSAHGRHQAVVLELMGVSLRVALHAYLHRPGASRRRGAPVRVITTVVRQLLEGLSLAHHHRLLHTDLKLENVALRLPSAAEAAAAAAAAAGTGGDGGAGRDGGGGGGGTAATDVDAEVAAFWSPGGVAHSPAGRIAIIDWGNTERLNDDYILPYAYQLQTESYRSPETIAGIGASPGSDLWSVGCMVWDLAVGRRLFKPDWKAPWGGAIDHLALMADVLGTPDRTFPPTPPPRRPRPRRPPPTTKCRGRRCPPPGCGALTATRTRASPRSSPTRPTTTRRCARRWSTSSPPRSTWTPTRGRPRRCC